jgi:hypothetical protein
MYRRTNRPLFTALMTHKLSRAAEAVLWHFIYSIAVLVCNSRA